MSEQDPFRVFVVHLFDENEDYRRVFEYLESRENFFYINFSNIEEEPASGAEGIRDTLRNQMENAEIVILPLAMSDLDPGLVGFQLDYAGAAKKPVLGIESFGSTVAIHKELIDRCDDVIEWNERTMISAIKRLARDEDTAQWETIDFKLD